MDGRDPKCVFCRIVAGEIPAARVYEDAEVLAFLDVGPLTPGHTLVIPKAHHASLAELPDEASARVAAVLPRICRAVKQATGAEGLNVLSNVGAVAGQSVGHVHWHVIPRHGGDAVAWPWHAGRYEDEGARERVRLAVAGALLP
jgi:histidine triad (HIT) family protein